MGRIRLPRVDEAQTFRFDPFGGHFVQDLRESFRQEDGIKSSAIFEEIAAGIEKVVDTAMEFMAGDRSLCSEGDSPAAGMTVGGIGDDDITRLRILRLAQFAQVTLEDSDLFFEFIEKDIPARPVGAGRVNLDPGDMHFLVTAGEKEGENPAATAQIDPSFLRLYLSKAGKEDRIDSETEPMPRLKNLRVTVAEIVKSFIGMKERKRGRGGGRLIHRQRGRSARHCGAGRCAQSGDKQGGLPPVPAGSGSDNPAE